VSGRRQALGAAGEAVAERFLRQLGYSILHRNLRLGRLGEIDLVASHQATLIFVEVKSKLQGEGLGGFGNITSTKQLKLRALGEAYLQRHPAPARGARFDAVEVEFISMDDKAPVIRHIPDAFR
jgi:putative endonuclease